MQLALYRECRPRTFSQIVGQEHVTRTLLNAIAQGRLSHGYLFCGPRGTGKTTTARILAKALNCQHQTDDEPCGQCPVCEGIARGEGVDVIEMDAASNRGVDEIRNLRERIRLAPISGSHKVYVIDEVHMLTNEAFNALLKTLEEPPKNVVFVLCTTEAYRVPPTILSRCQRFDFHRLPTADIAKYLQTVAADRSWDVTPPAATAIARAASGSMRDALGILDQCTAYSSDQVGLAEVRRVLGAVDPATFAELAASTLVGDLAGAWTALDALLSQGRDSREVARGLANHYRDVLLHRISGGLGEPNGPLADDPAEISRHSELASERALYEFTDALAAAEAEMRLAPHPRLLLEARLVRICSNASASKALDRVGSERGPSPTTIPVATRPTEQSRRQPPAQAAPLPEPPDPEPLSLDSPPSDTVPTSPPPPPPPAELRSQQVAVEAPAVRSKAVAPRVDNAKGGGSAPFDQEQLQSAWQSALAQLSDKDRGLLDGAWPGWEGRFFCVWLPADREAMAEFLSGRPVAGALAKALAGHFGRDIDVRIRAKVSSPGLFADQFAAEAEPAMPKPVGTNRLATDPAPQLDQRETGQHDAGSSGAESRDDAVIKEAQEMFRAEEVGKGVT